MLSKRWLAAFAASILTVQAASADVQLSGLADFVVRNIGEDDVTNRNFPPTSNLDVTRLRIFVDAGVAENAQFFTQFLVSSSSDAYVYGAYLKVEEPGGAPLNLHVGLIPGTVGTFAERTYSDRNPLVGIPLAYNHHVVLNPFRAQPSIDQLLLDRADRSHSKLPIFYDNCWNTGVEVYGQAGEFDWSVGALSGSTTFPMRNQPDKLPQGTARLGWSGSPGLAVGASGWLGPYLDESMEVQNGVEDRNDYLAGGFGGDFHGAWRYLEVYSEVYRAFWEHPQLPALHATSGYAEAKYKFLPRWYGAARFDFFEPDRVTDSQGEVHPWDYPLHRVEYGIGYKPARRITTKLVAQHNRFDGNSSLDENHYLVQVSAGF
jgi:hypothetical protein